MDVPIMEEDSGLRAYCTRLSAVLSPPSDADATKDMNDVLSRFSAVGISPASSLPSDSLDSWLHLASSVPTVYGSVLCYDSDFRRISSACALSIVGRKDLDVTEGWLKFRFLFLSCLLNPFSSSDVIGEFPDIALSFLVEFMDAPGVINGLVLEHLTLLWRLRHDARLQRKAHNALCELLKFHETTALIKLDLDSCADAPETVLLYKFRLLRGLSAVINLPNYSDITNWLSSTYSDVSHGEGKVGSLDILGDRCSPFSDLHIVIVHLNTPKFECKNLVCIGNRVSYLRSRNVVINDSFVELDYSSDVLSSMLCNLDVSLGSIVSGECCKEFYIYELANRVGISHDLISRIYTDERTDVKTLLGQWICTEKVGEFKFNYGILTTAMRSGRWLIFDETLSDSIACLLYSVCQQGFVTIPELNETVEASSNFHFFITTKHTSTLGGSLKHLQRACIPPLSESDCVDIISDRYVTLRPICKSVVSSFFALRDKLNDHRGFNMSDLFKISHRLHTSGTAFDGYLSSSTKGVILEAFYCVLLAGISCDNARLSLLSDIAEQFGVSRSSSHGILPINQIKGHDTTRVHLKVLHQLMSCYLNNEAVLLVGETGSGKTAIVQHFAKLTGNALKVYVFSEQSEAEDLIGSFFPDNIADVSTCLFNRALVVFLRCCVVDDNILCFLDHLVELFRKGLYPKLIRVISVALGQLLSSNVGELESEITTLRTECNMRCGAEAAAKLNVQLHYLQQPLESIPSGGMVIYEKYKDMLKEVGPNLQFKFEEGLLIQAIREGSWILLDEINLAPSDLLQRFVGILSRAVNKFELYECGNRVIDIHENFRVFACMNPPIIRKGDFVTFTSGKKELPSNFRAQMTEIFVDSIDTIEDISIVVSSYVDQDDRSIPCDDICHFYHRVLEMCHLSELDDGSFKCPTFTLRNLVRTIRYIQCVMKRCHRAIRDGKEAFVDAALSCFASSLGPLSFSKVVSLLPSLPSRSSTAFEESVDYVRIEGYWIRRGSEPIHKQDYFIVTPNIQKNLRRICRVLSGLRVPVLLEGPTACGKTSLVQYLSELTGHRCVRINNHEHTDLSEYLGQFVFDSASGQLRFNYGPIVTAMREGHWVILDELNLAPSQILEALNRILDDNREIYVPETGETIKSHPEFMIFATQNPANSIYGGRKQLSKAFCNRFVQLYIDGLDAADLQQVLHQRCHIPLSRAEKIVSAFQAIQACPMNSMVFERQSVLITLRDLIKWANRVRVDDEGLAYYGWCVIAEKLRNPAEQEIVREVLERCCLLSKPAKPKYLRVDYASDLSLSRFLQSRGLSKSDLCAQENYLWFEGTTTRLVTLLLRALENSEPVLLVGDTGIGKTTICQLLAKLQGRRLNILNLSKNSESNDFIGSFRPIRGLKSFHANVGKLIDYFEDDVRCAELLEYLREVMSSPLARVNRTKFLDILGLVSVLLDGDMASDDERHIKRQKMKSLDPAHMRTVVNDIVKSFTNALFEWVDGPLTRSMELGEWFLADEISLADDAVLEKMNSVLELPSTLTIPEAGGDVLRVIRANPNFRFLATMNPGGDHGKRELSPALLNRFTVIYIPTPDIVNFETLRNILDHYSCGQPDWVAHSIVDVMRLHNERCPHQKLTLRDIIKWAELLSTAKPLESFLHGAHVIFLDNFFTGVSGISLKEVLCILSHHNPTVDVDGTLESFNNNSWVHSKLQNLSLDPISSIHSYNLESKNCLHMVGKILRALEVNRPILLEGEPGVGKSASISALASLCGFRLLRVNLSEHTDIMDLFGSDIPAVVDGIWKFVWHNGPVLEAAVNGYWIVLDELNLASQQVLEGLNALLDHRRETFIPELDRFIKCHESFRLFASQNPAIDGCGRKHLPKSFLNRFTKIYCPPLEEHDYTGILAHLYPDIPSSTVSRIVCLLLYIKSMDSEKAWEWNLRDCLRLCDALSRGVPSGKFEEGFRFVFMSRLASRKNTASMLHALFGDDYEMGISKVRPFAWYPVDHVKGGMDVDNGDELDNKVVNAHQETIGTVHKPPKSYCYEPIWMQSQEEVHHTVHIAAHLNFPVLLVGPASSGKQSVIKCLASRCGQSLVELTILPCFDTNDLLGGFEQVGDSDGGSSPGSFRWVDSPLVSSIENGSWMLLSRIHHANPAILDRLNSLLEVGGNLALNESGNCNRVIKPHPNFRIFMTADSKYVGRLSRAFRNRCMEVHMGFPDALHPILNEAPKCQFMDNLYHQIGGTLASLGVIPEDISIDQPRKVVFRCSTLIDGARLVRSVRNYTWPTCVAMSLCNCVLGWYLSEFAFDVSSHCDWLFLKSWCMLDTPLGLSTREVSRLLPPEFQDAALQILECCLDWCFHNIADAPCSALNLVTDFLQRCTIFDDRFQRDMIVAGFDKGVPDEDSTIWFMFRGSVWDYEKRYQVVASTSGMAIPQFTVEPLLQCCISSDGDTYEIQSLFSFLGFDFMKYLESLGSAEFLERLSACLVNMLVKGESVMCALSKLQFMSYLLANKTNDAPITTQYTLKKVSVEVLDTLRMNLHHGPALIKQHEVYLTDYSTDLIGGRISSDLDLALELHCHGLYAIIPNQRNLLLHTESNVTIQNVLEFVDAYVEYMGSSVKSCMALKSGTVLSIRRVETPNPALAKFVYDRLKFLCCWLCHQFLVGDTSGAMLRKVYDYAAEILNLYVGMQSDLPSSFLPVLVSTLASLRILMNDGYNCSFVYQIVLDTWSLHDTISVDVELDLLGYMVSLVNGSEAGLSGISASVPQLETLDDITSVVLFWDCVSKDNGLPSLRANLQRIECMHKMLSESIPMPQWSGLFFVLTLVSPILSKALSIDAASICTNLRSLYTAITLEEVSCVEMFDAFSPDNIVMDSEDPNTTLPRGLHDISATIHRLATRIMQLLSKLASSPVESRVTLISDIWRMCGLLLIMCIPNMGVVVADVQAELDREYRNNLRKKLERRLEKYVRLDMLSDGDCCRSYNFLTAQISELSDGEREAYSLRSYTPEDESVEHIGTIDTIALLSNLQCDLTKFCRESLKLGSDFTIRCDLQCLLNFRHYLLRQYVVVPEVLRPLLIGLYCLVFGISGCNSGSSKVVRAIPRTVQYARVAKQCLTFPFNILKRVSQGDLINLSAQFYDSKGLYDVCCYVNCLLSSVRHDLLRPTSMECLKYAVLLLSGIASKLKIERSDGQEMRMSLLQSCIAMAQQSAHKGVHDLLPSQQEIVRAIIRDCGPMDEYEALDLEDDEPIKEVEQNRELERIAVICRMLTIYLRGGAISDKGTYGDARLYADSAQSDMDGQFSSESSSASIRHTTRQMNSALCLSIACGIPCTSFFQYDESVMLSRRVMAASEEHFGYQATLGNAGFHSFYKSVDINCCMAAWDIMTRLGVSVQALLSQFERQQQLLDIESMLASISKVRLPTVTQALLVTLLENLVARVHKWNAISHSGISLRELSSELENLILDLRRSELKGWYLTIDDRLASFRESSYSCLVYFMEMCSSMHDASVSLPTRISNCASEIMTFVMATPLAHFEPVFEMLRTVVSLYRDTSIQTEVVMCSVLENIMCFLELWKPIVASRISALKQESHREVNELVKRINWSGNDYVSICTLVHKQKSQLSSVLRRFQEGIAQPWSTVYATSSVQWYSVDGLGQVDEVSNTDGTTSEDAIGTAGPTVASHDADDSTLLECLRSNIEYVRTNKKEISRVHITRITMEVGKLLTDCGYKASSGHDAGDWLSWLDLGTSMRCNGCKEAEQARDHIMRTLHIICDINESFRKDKDMHDFFSRNVDLNIFGYLVSMLRAAQSNIVDDVAEFERCTLSQYMHGILDYQAIYQMNCSCLHQMLSIVDDIYEGALQANDNDLFLGPLCEIPSCGRKPFKEEPNRPSRLLNGVSEFRSWLKKSAEFRAFDCLRDIGSTFIVSGVWLEAFKTFCGDIESFGSSSLPMFPYFHREASRLGHLIATAKAVTDLPTIEVKEFKSKDSVLPLACLYMAQLIDSIAHVEPPQGEETHESRDEWAAGTGLEDGTGAKNVSDDVEPEEGMFDNFKKDSAAEPGDMSGENPSVDVDLEFEGGVFDVEDAQESSDIEEDDNPCQNEDFDDLQKTQLDSEVVDEEPPLEGSGDPLDIEGVSMDDSKEAADGSDADVNQSGRDNNYTSEVEQISNDPEPQSLQQEVGDQSGNDTTDDNKADPDGTPNEGGENADELLDEPGSEPAPDIDIDENDLDLDGGDQMDTDDVVSEEGGNAIPDPHGNDDVVEDHDAMETDLPDAQASTRKEYNETPYGAEGEMGSTIRPDEQTEVGGNSYEEDSLAGSHWGEASRSRGGMLSFLDMIQRLESPPESSSSGDLKLKNISDNVNDCQNSTNHESMDNQLDETSNQEGLSASVDGSAVPNVDMTDMFSSDRKPREQLPSEFLEGSDATSSVTEPKPSAATAIDNEPTPSCENETCSGGVDTSAVFSGIASVGMGFIAPSELPSRDGSSVKDADRGKASAMWRQFREETSAISTALCEQMRIIFEPTLNSGLQGDYKTGKRVSIRKLMAFIASNYQRDKIWLRRTKPNKRDYRVVLAIDNSRSMTVSGAGSLALKSFACIYQAMSVLEVGKLSVCKFGGNVPELLLEMDGGEEPCRVVAGMTFDEESRHSHETGLPELLKYVLRYLERQGDHRKIVIIISDGKFNKDKARPWIQAAISNQVVPLLVILDPLTSGNKSILQMKHVREIDGCLTVETFLSNFPFPYYAVIQNLDRLPSILSDLLRQWFALSNQR